MTSGYQFTVGNPSLASESRSQMKKGRIEPIELKIQRKAGNKVVSGYNTDINPIGPMC